MRASAALLSAVCAAGLMFLTCNTSNPADSGGAPVITAQPSSQTVNEGASVTFTITATGDPAPTYQWQKDGNDISGATGATYTIASTTTAHSGVYRCVVSNSAGSVTSYEATLSVNPSSPTAPSIVQQPASQTVNEGASVTFTVVATGNPSPSYQWRKNGASIPGATSSTYTIVSVTQADAGIYSVYISNTQGNVTSSNAVLTVNEPPEVLTYTVSGDSITISMPEYIRPYTYCNGSTLLIGYDTSDAWTETMWFNVTATTLTFDMGGLVTMDRVGPGTGLIGTWVVSDTGYDMPDTLIFDATTITAIGSPDGNDCPAEDYIVYDWYWDTNSYSGNLNGSIVQLSCSQVIITGNVTGEQVTITWNANGDMTYTSTNGSHAAHTWYENPGSCPNPYRPDWWWSSPDGFLTANQKTAPAAKRAVSQAAAAVPRRPQSTWHR